MGYNKNGIYILGGDGQIPSITTEQLNKISNNEPASIVQVIDTDSLLLIKGDSKKNIVTETVFIAEDFEGGVPPYLNFTADGPDQFYVNSFEPFEGNNSLINCNNGGASNRYSNNVSIHAWFDLAVPDNLTEISVAMILKCASEGGFDGVEVFACDTSVNLTGGTVISDNGSSINNLSGLISSLNNFTFEDFNIPSKYIGDNVRIVFQFTSDGSINSGYTGLNIDNLIIKGR